jgi:hypothetical protein
MSELNVTRTPELIASEINGIKEQARAMVTYHSVEIGRRLVEAKGLLKHGEWEHWLETSVDYSQRTATNLMRIFKDFGNLPLLGGGVKSQSLANLGYTQAVALLGLPADEREAFVESHDMEAMSTRELQQAIKERDDAKAEAARLEQEQELAKKQLAAAEKQAADRQATIDQLTKAKAEAAKTQTKLEEDLRKAKAKQTDDSELKRMQEQLTTAQRQVKELTVSLEEASKPAADIPATVVEVVPEAIQKELDQARERNQKLERQLAQANEIGLTFKVHFTALKDAFKVLHDDIKGMPAEDTSRERYRNAMITFTEMMRERLAGLEEKDE